MADEPLDRNKSDLTHRATATVAAWLEGIGAKPVETEVDVGGWIYDVASFWSPTMTEAKRSRLLRDMPCPKDICKTSADEFAWLCRQVGGRITIGVEVKVSRSDFLADLGRKYGTFNNPARLRCQCHALILATTSGVLHDNELLKDCGKLMLSEDGTRVVKWYGPWHLNPVFPIEIEDHIAAIAIRRDHNTRYARLRRFLKLHRAGRSEERRVRNPYVKEAPDAR